jgi:hypothetical protein
MQSGNKTYVAPDGMLLLSIISQRIDFSRNYARVRMGSGGDFGVGGRVLGGWGGWRRAARDLIYASKETSPD